MTQVPLSADASADDPSHDRQADGKIREIAEDVAYRQILLVNVVFVGLPQAGDGHWVLIDAGLPGSAGDIKSAAKARFGGSGRPGPSL